MALTDPIDSGESTFHRPKYYTVKEIAHILAVKTSYVYELIDSGELKALRLSERRIRVPAAAFDQFIKDVEYNAARPATPVTIECLPITKGVKR